MALTDITAKDFEKVLVDGMCKLIEAIINSRARDFEPLLVTISRRMPHVLFWYKYAFASEQQKRLLDEVEVITEIALPFINFHPKKRKIELIIVDDVVSSGQTLQYVTLLTHDISQLSDPRIFVFFCDEESESFIRTSKSDKVYVGYIVVGKDEKERLKNFISTIIAATLPIDVTYPLLYLKENEVVKTIEPLKDIFIDPQSLEIDNYSTKVDFKITLNTKDKVSEIQEGCSNCTYTSMLPSELSNSLNNDFAKIRTYYRVNEFVVVPYAPNILSDKELRDRELFECKEYRNIWSLVLDYVNDDYFKDYDYFDEDSESKERIMNRAYRSLASVANYLYSLSSFNRILKVNEVAEDVKFDVREEDLCLIIGKKLSQKILPLISIILRDRLVSPRVHRKINVATTLIPQLYEKDYTLSKYMSMVEDNLEDDLMSIFVNAQERRHKYPALLVKEMEYDIEGIMESFESLETALLIKSYENKVEVNKWVDLKIDEGLIVSRYAYAFGDNNLRYWRRFFRMSTSLTV